MFETDATLHSSLNYMVYDLLYDEYTQTLREPQELNELDRNDLADDFVELYLHNHGDFIDDYREEMNSKESDEEIRNKLKEYSSFEIDALIPKMYYIEKNKELCNKYSQLLVRRIYDTVGKDGFEDTEKINYQFEHDFKKVKEMIESTKASDKQINYLRQLGEKIGYLLWNEKFISKTYANHLIEYLSEKTYDEPAIFSFFFVPK